MKRTHYGKDKEALLRRLKKMEGQTRGIQQMVEEDRYCLDVVQQVSALTAAAQEVSLLVIEDHLLATMTEAGEGLGAGSAAIDEVVTVLRKALRS